MGACGCLGGVCLCVCVRTCVFVCVCVVSDWVCPPPTAMEYLRTWFGIDLVATFPWELVLIAIEGMPSIVIRGFKMPRVLRLLRLRKEMEALERGVWAIRMTDSNI